jgi:hypothetical protein
MEVFDAALGGLRTHAKQGSLQHSKLGEKAKSSSFQRDHYFLPSQCSISQYEPRTPRRSSLASLAMPDVYQPVGLLPSQWLLQHAPSSYLIQILDLVINPPP